MLHNHPSSSLAPSREDREVTGKMMYAGSFLDIELQDHIIVAGRTGETFSMREHLPELFDRKKLYGADGTCSRSGKRGGTRFRGVSGYL